MKKIHGGIVMKITDTYKRNFDLIAKNKLQVGINLVHKTTGRFIEIINIHPMYGWVITKNCTNEMCPNLKGDLSNLNEFAIITRYTTWRDVIDDTEESREPQCDNNLTCEIQFYEVN